MFAPSASPEQNSAQGHSRIWPRRETKIAATGLKRKARIDLDSTLSIWPCAWNPPNGSWGMVKVQPTGAALTARIPPTAVGGWLRSGLPNPVSRPLRQPGSLDFNHPPTAVGGI